MDIFILTELRYGSSVREPCQTGSTPKGYGPPGCEQRGGTASRFGDNPKDEQYKHCIGSRTLCAAQRGRRHNRVQGLREPDPLDWASLADHVGRDRVCRKHFGGKGCAWLLIPQP